ncbi:ATP-binding protein [Bacillus sp. ISL-51]|uniref:ATP-binding protein n=1 Tax=Bacteria TaxID=2 RepID=UPI001BECA12A|nr:MULTISPECIES: ATP-binding protein [Bacteria]MBT2573716.1 ATP-binding protein [Bacillus sp. ISL-51]MBT2634953.1 ATP-binding protein [Bacillus sp. ISL-26]MBT2712429.1 ATP-binding protein [Pseudomonas sp. ISL-88]
MTKRTIEQILADLKNGKRPLLADRPGESDESRYDCQLCKDQGGFLRMQNGTDVWVKCGCADDRKVKRLLGASEITDAFRKLNFKGFRTSGKPQAVIDAYDCALEFIENFDRIKNSRKNSIALLGRPGTGKTHLLTALSNDVMKQKQTPVVYFPFVEGFTDLKNDFDLLDAKLSRMKQVDVLFIDDLFKPLNGKPRATDWQIEQMYAVINYRYLNHKPILLSSELACDELVRIDEALGTRIYEMCSDYLVIIKGNPYELNHRLEGAR